MRRPLKTVKIRPAIKGLAVREVRNHAVIIDFVTAAAFVEPEIDKPEGFATGILLAKPREVVQLLGLDPISAHMLKGQTRLDTSAVGQKAPATI